MTLNHCTDIVIFGGGVAGLWLLKRLRLEGYQAILIESNGLGSGQTLASQGIIHGGLKYALGGRHTAAANAIANMPTRWRQCLAGQDRMDLRGVKVLSEQVYLWSAPGFRSGFKAFLGSKSLRGRVTAIGKDHRPDCFAGAAGRGQLYQLPDFVIDSPSLVAELAKDQADCLFQADSDQVDFLQAADQSITGLTINTADALITIHCQRCIFSAGEGNAALMSRCGIDSIAMQRRSLHMVTLKHPALPVLYAHCITADLSLTPKLTVTSHQDTDGQPVWYLGGQLAEAGIIRTGKEQTIAAQRQLQVFFPWLELEQAQWNSFHIDRAEASTANRQRPDDAVFTQQNNAIVVFPTKFTLIPTLADRLVAHLQASAAKATGPSSKVPLGNHLPRPPMGRTRW